MYATDERLRILLLPEQRASYDDVGNRMSDIVRSCSIRIYHRLLRYLPDYLATRCKPVRNRLGEFIGRSCVGLWKTATRYIRLLQCAKGRNIGNYSQASLPAIPVGTSRESAGATNRRTGTVKSPRPYSSILEVPLPAFIL